MKPPGTAPPPRRWALPDGRAPYLQTFLQPFLRQLCEQQSAFAVQAASDGKHAGSVVVVLLVDVVVVAVAGTVVVVGAALVVVLVVDTVVVVVVVAAVVVVVVPATVVVVVGWNSYAPKSNSEGLLGMPLPSTGRGLPSRS